LQVHSYDGAGKRLADGPANFRRLGEVNAGDLADLHTLRLRFSETVRLTGVKSTPDFRIEQGGSCVEGNVYHANGTCTLLVRFTPQGAGRRTGHIDISHTGLGSPTPMVVSGFSFQPVISFIPSVISTVAGTNPSGSGLLSGAQNLAIDGGDTLYAADTGNNNIRQYDSSNTWTTISGATATAPLGVAADSFGQVWYSQPSSNGIFEIFAYGPIIQASGTGNDACSYTASPLCNLAAESVNKPGSISINANDTMFFEENSRGAAFSQIHPEPATLVRLYDPFTYQTTNPGAFAVDVNNNLYSQWTNAGVCTISIQPLYYAEQSLADYSKFAGGRLCGFSGDGGMAKNAEISTTLGQFAFDQAGDFYFADSGNQRVRRVEAVTHVIRTIAGTGTAGYTGDGAGGPGAELSSPTGIAVDSQGAVYIISSGTTGQVIRKVGPSGILNFNTQGKNVPSAAHQSIVTNTGNSTMQLTGFAITGPNASEFKLSTPTTTCSLTSGATLSIGQTCQIGVIFTPAAAGSRTATLSLLNNTVSGFSRIQLIGVGVKPSPTFTITSPTGGSSFKSGTAVAFGVKVTSTLTPAPTGTIQFKVDGANFGGPVTLAGGVASTSVTGLTQISHTLSAVYNGDANYAPAGPISVSITVTAVKVGSFVSLSPTINAAGSCAAPAFSVGVKGASGPAPTGEVALLDGGKLIGSGTLANGRATLATQGLSAGPHTLTARYAGDALHLASVSSGLVENTPPTKPCAGPVSGNGARSLAF
jgi:hypothetical protein